MKQLLPILTILMFSAFCAKAQSPVIVAQPYDFQKWIRISDSIKLTNAPSLSDSSDKAITSRWVKQQRFGLGGGSGTVTNVSVANGYPFSVINPTTTPQIIPDTTTPAKRLMTQFATDNSYVSLTGLYGNPSWLTSLAWSKITGTPTTVSGYGISDAATISALNLKVDSLRRKVGSDSVFQYSNGVKSFAFRDSTGAGGAGGGISDSIYFRRKGVFYIVNDGQSNAVGGAQVGAGTAYDTLSDLRVQVFDTVSRVFKTAYLNQTPYSTTNGNGGSGNAAWYFARKYARTTGDTVRIIQSGKGAQPIAQWFNAGVSQWRLDTTIQRINQSGIPRVDLFIWDQGESDNGTPSATYNAAWDSIKANLRRRSVVNKTTPIVVVGMPQVSQGSASGYQGQDGNLQSFDYNSDIWDGYASTDSAHCNGYYGVITPDPHFSNEGYKTLGEISVWSCIKAVPSRYFEKNNGGIPNGTAISPKYVDVLYPDLISGRVEGITARDSSATGVSGIAAFKRDSTTIVGLYAPSSSVFGTVPLNRGIVGTRKGMLSIMVNSNEWVFFDTLAGRENHYYQNSFQSSSPTQFVGTNTNGTSSFQLTDNGSIFASVGVNNSTTAYPNSFFIYQGSVYKMFSQGLGTIFTNGGAQRNPRSTLDIDGSLTEKIDSISTTVSLNANHHNIWFKTGSTLDTAFVPNSTTCYGRIYTIQKTDAGTGVVTVSFATTDSLNRTYTQNLNLTVKDAFIKIRSNGINGWEFEGNTVLKANATLSFPLTAAQSSSELTVTVSGALIGDVATVNSNTNPVNSSWSAYVSSANTVTIRFSNYSAAGITPTASSNFYVRVFK